MKAIFGTVVTNVIFSLGFYIAWAIAKEIDSSFGIACFIMILEAAGIRYLAM